MSSDKADPVGYGTLLEVIDLKGTFLEVIQALERRYPTKLPGH
jgi:hypothetical protein